jgi:hypothetical protein
MTKPSPKDRSAQSESTGTLGVKSDTMSAVPNDDQIKGGVLGLPVGGLNPTPILFPKSSIISPRAGTTTLNPTSSDGCCGGD